MDGLQALWGFGIAALVALLATPLAGRASVLLGAVDQPKERGLHDRPMPRMGGPAILLAVLVGAAPFLLPGTAQTRAILVGAIVITAVGALDDALDLGAAFKLAGQLAAAAIPVLSGVFVDHFTLPLLGRVEMGQGVGSAVTVIGIVAVMNMVNFSDGVDGLAAGVCAIAAVTFALIAVSLSRYGAGVLAAATAGAAAGFLWHNFHPAKVFMGDSGSNLLGLLLACVAIQGVLKTAAVVALAFPLMILAVPLLDTGFVVAKRIKYRRPVYRADDWHFHHRFANIGFSQRRTVLYLYGWTLALAALALALRFVPYSDDHGDFDAAWTSLLGAFGAIAVAASVYLVYVLEILKFRRFRERQLRRVAAHDGGHPTEAEIDAEIEREVETGEFEAVARE